jgi:excinuclease ABC subunit C
MSEKDLKKILKKIPDSPGVYFFMGKKTESGINSPKRLTSSSRAGNKESGILYIGKATSLQSRVRSYFNSDLMSTRGPIIAKMIEEISGIKWEETDSVLEALILEAHYIRKFQPPYNSREKDNKSFNYVVITKEDFPRILTVRGRQLGKFGLPAQIAERFVAGPFPNGNQLKEALKIIRKIFPYRDKCTPFGEIKNQKSKVEKPKPCFNRQIGLCPGVCTGEINKKDYGKIIKNIEFLFQGKKKQTIKNLEKEMKVLAKNREFEKASEIKQKIFALNHIQDIALIKRETLSENTERKFRIEAYDIAHIGGAGTVGVMVVVENGEPGPADYRKFKIRGISGKVGVDDTANLKEVLTRRLGHLNWPLPNLIVVDGGIAQINAARQVLGERNLNIEVVSVVKDEKHRPRDIIGGKAKIENLKNEILLANSEAHRFALAYHRKLVRRGRFH